MSTVDVILQDLRLAARALRKRLGFTVVAVLTLAIGIGANVAIFGAVDTMLLRRLPFRDPDQLMVVSMTRPPMHQMPAMDDWVWSLPKFAVFRDAQTVFSDVTVYADWQTTVLGGDGAQRLEAEVTDDHYLPTLGIRPAHGRNFTADETRVPNGPKVALLGDALWRQRFDADSAVVGHTINLGGQPYTIVGVMPPGFHGLSGRAQLWATIMAARPEAADGSMYLLTLIARRKPGVSPALAKDRVRQLGARVDEAFPEVGPMSVHWGAVARELDARRVEPVVRRALLALFGAVGIVLLIACANVANLLLVRAAGRQREIAIRVALGAPRRRLVGQLFTESALLAAIGGAAGTALAWWSTGLLVALDPTRTARHWNLRSFGLVSFDQMRFDGTALAFAAAITLGTCLLFGLLPALYATRSTPRPGVQERHDARGRALLASVQVALAVVLLVGSGLLIRSLSNLLSVPLGFDASGVLTVGLGRPDALEDALYPGAHDGKNDDLLPGYYDRVVAAIGSLPGVTSVALEDCLPLSGGCHRTPIQLLDRPPLPNGELRTASHHEISANWPSMMRVPVVQGRAFTDADRAHAPKVVLVGETAARRLWPGEDPIGKPLNLGLSGFDTDTARVVGVVGDVRYASIDSVPDIDIYVSYLQMPDVPVTMLVRTAGDPLALVASLRRAIHGVAPNAPVYDARRFAQRVGDSMALARFGTSLLTSFATVALVLAMLGVYGVLAFTVVQRTREIGIRLALGATPVSVVHLVVGRGVVIAAAGGIVGIVGAQATTRVLRSLLYDVAPSDPATYIGIIVLLIAAVIAASWIPARQASRVAPAEALRVD